MGKFIKTCFIIGICCVMAGIGLSGAGIINGGLPGLIEEIKKGDWSIDLGDKEPFFELEVPEYFDKNELINVDVAQMQQNFSADNVKELVIKGVGISLEILEYDGKEICVEQSGVQQFQAYAKENSITVIGQNKYVNHTKGKISIMIPEDVINEGELAITVVSTACTMDFGDIHASDMSMVMTAGTISWDDLIVGNLHISMEAGIMKGNETIVSDAAALTVSAGSMDIEGTLGASTAIEMNAGKLNLTLRDAYEDYNYSVSCAGGMVKVGEHQSKGIAEGFELDNQASKNIEVVCSVGAVNIDYIN